jgi:2-polyprenyl-3-methyl-5-hydroxy-6-metoxy-1,4-benzoquinol methylase
VGGDWREELHRRRLREVIRFAETMVTDWSSVSILDIGAGIGLLYDELKKKNAQFQNYVALEPVSAIALLLKKHFPTLICA